MKQKNSLRTVLLLAPFILGFALALDIYVPSIPDLCVYFSVPPGVVQLTVSLFILTTGLGQLIVGPLSDCYGRRKIIISATTLYLAGSIVSTFSPDISTLILARMAQGFGACGMMVTCFAIVRDLFSGDECAKIYSFLNSTIALSPLLAPSIGGYLALYFGWRATFAFLALIAFLIVLLTFFKVKESLPVANRVNLSKDIFVNYKLILKSRTFVMYTLCSSAGFAGFLTFFSVSPYIVIDLLSIPKQHFGIYFASIGLIFFIGSIVCGYVVKNIGTYRTALLGTILMTLAGVVMWLWYIFFGLSMFGFMGPMMIMGFGGAFLMGAGAGGAIEPFPDMAGAASALFGSCQFVFGFVVSTVVLKWKITSTMPLALTMLVLGASVLILCAAKKYSPRRV
ncbi:MAG: multidrug effflux MFS transporter [Pseudomonadota bacterium]